MSFVKGFVSNQNNSNGNNIFLIRREKSSKFVKGLIYVQDYVCNASKQHWCNIVDYLALSTYHHQMARTYDTYGEPRDY